ncbi:MAG: response regulator [Verrucomicrobiae bacterium]|nr:response regulator [Verrucomicrobiae bacterium]NNJ43600.1 response regulator [Akkermansiaceae bacterium]
MTAEPDIWKKRYDREKIARLQAEKLLEDKSSQLFEANERLEQKIILESSKLRREEKKFTTLFHSSIDGIILHTPDGVIIDVNPTICDLLEIDSDQLIGSNIDALYPSDSVDQAQQAMVTVNRLGHTRFECLFNRSDDTHIQAEVYASKFEVDDQIIIQEVIRDITERNRIAYDLEKASQEAIKANEAKSLFLATMSHEIRTPLNGIIGFTDILLQEVRSDEQKHHLNIIKKSSDILLNVINDILDFSRVESQQIELEQVDFDLIDFIEGTLDIQAQTAAIKHVELLYTVQENMPQSLHGDAGRLRQVLLNLVSNGLKFTDEGSVIIHASHPDTQTVELKVTDTGIGFDPAITKQLFQPFQQADASTTRKYGGTGLGLAICKQLIAAMGGSIQANSTPGEGSQFTITLPYTPAKNPRCPVMESYDVSKIKNTHVLVISDHPMYLKFMSARLNKRDCPVTTALSGKDALDLMADTSTTFQVILIDRLIPDMDGLHFPQKARACLGDKTPPLVLVTSSRLTAEKKKALSLGYHHVIYKPVREKELLAALYRATHAPDANSASDPSQPTSPGLTNKPNTYALIVEDNSINARLVKLLLERLGITAHIAHNGAEAIESLKIKKIYDVILMDMQMPIMDGLEASRRIRRGEVGDYYTSTPIIALTANAQTEDQVSCLKAGMDHYLPKPINAEQLDKVLQEYQII